MSVQIIIVTAISFVAMGLIAIVSVPIVYNLAFQQDAIWNTMPAEAKLARDNIWNTWEIWIPALFFVTIIWAIRRATRNDQQDY